MLGGDGQEALELSGGLGSKRVVNGVVPEVVRPHKWRGAGEEWQRYTQG